MLEHSFSQGPDPDNNGETVRMENAETCFYTEMDWLGSKGNLKFGVAISDFKTLTGTVK